MSEVSPSQDQLSEEDRLYRRLSAVDPGRPGEWVRRKVQAYAAQQAAERAVRATAKTQDNLSATGTVPQLRIPPAAAAAAAAAAEGSAPPTGKPWLIPAIA